MKYFINKISLKKSNKIEARKHKYYCYQFEIRTFNFQRERIVEFLKTTNLVIY